jgi:NADH:ubiquinone oxidoreductase, NADH-binding (51 kD) subunit
MPKHELILLKNMMQPGYTGSLQDYERAGGYQALRKVVGKVTPTEVTMAVMKSGLRGRGGAGFPTGVKWGFLPKDYEGPRYLCCNADESEPGTFKDRQLIERDPHQLLEGIVLACYAIGAESAYIYIRGEFVLGAKILERAIAEARIAGYIGTHILGTGITANVWVHEAPGPISAEKKRHCWSRLKANAACLASNHRSLRRTASTTNRPW